MRLKDLNPLHPKCEGVLDKRERERERESYTNHCEALRLLLRTREKTH